MEVKKYYSVIYDGIQTVVCSVHNTEFAAIKAAIKCENSGGTLHTILEVKKVKKWK